MVLFRSLSTIARMSQVWFQNVFVTYESECVFSGTLGVITIHHPHPHLVYRAVPTTITIIILTPTPILIIITITQHLVAHTPGKRALL